MGGGWPPLRPWGWLGGFGHPYYLLLLLSKGHTNIAAITPAPKPKNFQTQNKQQKEKFKVSTL
jgi:hypothetical protein